MDSSSLLRFNRVEDGVRLSNNFVPTNMISRPRPVSSSLATINFTSQIRPSPAEASSNVTPTAPLISFGQPSTHRSTNFGGTQRHIQSSYFNRYENIRSSNSGASQLASRV